MILAMILRESRLLFPFFHKVDKKSDRHGGELVAQVIKSHGIETIYASDQQSPIVGASRNLDIKVVDLGKEASSDCDLIESIEASDLPNVVIVTAESELSRIIDNFQATKSPMVVIAVSSVSSRGFIRSSSVELTFKKILFVDCIRDITDTLREAFRLSMVEVPGLVAVEIIDDLLYPYDTIIQRLASVALKENNSQHWLKSKLMEVYIEYSANQIFADAWKDREFDPLPIRVNDFNDIKLRR